MERLVFFTFSCKIEKYKRGTSKFKGESINGKIGFARHGESEWNKANLFTGWADVDLSEKGTQQAIDAGKLIKEAGIEFDLAFTSVLKRAIKTTNLALEAADQLWVPVEKSWRLNERHYGGLTGLNKAEAVPLNLVMSKFISGVVLMILCHQKWLKIMSIQHTLTVAMHTLMIQLFQMQKT